MNENDVRVGGDRKEDKKTLAHKFEYDFIDLNEFSIMFIKNLQENFENNYFYLSSFSHCVN
jgi:hypothetical protein